MLSSSLKVALHTATVIAPNWLGDAVMCLPTLARLRAAHPGCAWTVLARPAVAPVFTLAQLGLTVRTLPAPPSLRIERDNGARPDLVLVLPNSFYAAVLAWRVGAKQRVGYAHDRRGFLLRPAVPAPEPGTIPAHESFYYLELARRAGLIAELPPESAPALRVPLHPDPDAVRSWRRRLGAGAVVALHVGASFGTAKRWLPERFAELAASLAGDGAQVVLVGGEAEREVGRNVRMLAARPFQIKNLAGETSLPSLAALLSAVDLLVANDSGPMHLAAAVGTPVVALFGSTNDRETYPLTAAGKLRLLKVPGIECSPCKLRECPIDHRCMTRMSVAEVLAAARAVLAETKLANAKVNSHA
ncbi:MAG TPA: lipopolysaccharide heptosyltransferase II [Terriglobales bacterium]|nr:lipopolysaccharide heptosyltransferase II [Terriglobales bacterium]